MLRPMLYMLCRIALAGALLAGASRPATAQPQTALHYFEAGNEHYEQGQYERALDAYRRVLDTGYASGALYYNLGNAHFRTDQLGRAILYYEKARRLLPDDPNLLHSLDVARRNVAAPSPPDAERAWSWTALAATVDPMNTFTLGLLLYLIGVGMLGYRLWTGTTDYVRLLYRTTLIGGLLLIAIALGTSYLDTLDRRVVVTADEASLHASPNPQAARDTTLQEGAVLELQRRQPSWTEVRLSNGQIGWLSAQAVEEV